MRCREGRTLERTFTSFQAFSSSSRRVRNAFWHTAHAMLLPSGSRFICSEIVVSSAAFSDRQNTTTGEA